MLDLVVGLVKLLRRWLDEVRMHDRYRRVLCLGYWLALTRSCRRRVHLFFNANGRKLPRTVLEPGWSMLHAKWLLWRALLLGRLVWPCSILSVARNLGPKTGTYSWLWVEKIRRPVTLVEETDKGRVACLRKKFCFDCLLQFWCWSCIHLYSSSSCQKL